jgi:catechol 2,3-dioxygenase-like lactoylglutathione lyase family enzyme
MRAAITAEASARPRGDRVRQTDNPSQMEVRMKRFHVHVAVPHLEESVRFYSTLFGAEPSVRKDDYAKWMLNDPRVNFAISQRGGAGGVNHLGFQVDSGEELEAMRAQLIAADRSIVSEKAANCCYAVSDKYWVTDPSGVAWETFHSLGSIPIYGDDQASQREPSQSGCCAPSAGAEAKSACCA